MGRNSWLGKIEKIVRTCEACPSQWEGSDENGNDIYIRYRWGCLSVYKNEKVIFDKTLDESGWGGVLDYDSLKKETKDILILPDKEENG